MRRVAVGLKMAFMLLFAIVTYAAMLKRGKVGSRVFVITASIGLVTVSVFTGAGIACAKNPVPAKKKTAPAGPPKQIYTRSDRSMPSMILGAEGKAAYIVSSLGTNSGILITDVTSGGVAANMGLSAGDVLLNINQRVVTTARDADRILGDIPSGTIRVSFARPGDTGLQLYNLNVRYAHQGAPAGMSTASSSGAGGPKNVGAALASQIPATESHMLGVINADRAREKAGPVSVDGTLAALARAHAQDMATRKFFNHVNPDGKNPQDRARAAGLKGTFENISYASNASDLISAADDAERQMMGEPPNQQNHRSNIIDPAHTSVGIGIAVSKDGTFYMLQEFAN